MDSTTIHVTVNTKNLFGNRSVSALMITESPLDYEY